jgi:hypothetical protein
MKVELSHDSLTQLLPWYANNTLTTEERGAVEEHLKSCAACQAELELLREVSGAMNEAADEAPSANRSLARTLAAIEQWEESKHPARQSRLERWMDSLWNPSTLTARWVFAAQFLLILALGTVLLIPRHDAGPGLGHILSGGEQIAGGTRVTVIFAPNTTVERMSQILSSLNAKIVSGPSAAGVYIVELPPGKEADVQLLIDKLRGNDAIQFVERQP